MGATVTQKSRVIFNEGKLEVNKAFTDATFEIFEKIFISMMFGRLVLSLISFKYLKVTKLMIYYHLLMALI